MVFFGILYNKLMNIFLQGLVWYSYDVPKEILKGWKNFLLFGLDYFSLPILLKTYFSHWHRYYYPYGKAFEFWKNIEVFVFNIMSRITGAILRTGLIILGLAAEILIFIIGLIVFISWLFFPVLLLAGFLFGLKLCLI